MAPPTEPVQASITNTVSVVFTPAFVADDSLPDLILVSADNVHFHVHRQRLLAASTNSFGGLLVNLQPKITLPETSLVVNTVLHLIYGISCLHFQPTLEATEAAVTALVSYGIPLESTVVSQPLHRLILSHAPHRPIEAYALAAHHQLEDTAAAVSAHLLAYDPSRLSDELSVKMGSVYFSRLFSLQRAPLAALKNIVLRPPATHPATLICGEDALRELARAWAFASADIVWNALPSTSIGAVQSAFAHAGTSVTCPDCREMLRTRLEEVVNEWSAVKRTI